MGHKTHESAKQKNVFLCHDAKAIKSALLKKYSSSMKLNKLELFSMFSIQVNLLETLTKIKEKCPVSHQSGFSNFSLHVIEKMLYIDGINSR